jgi:hypothetical protein
MSYKEEKAFMYFDSYHVLLLVEFEDIIIYFQINYRDVYCSGVYKFTHKLKSYHVI